MNFKNLRYEIGLSLTVVGVTIGMLLNYTVPVVKWSPIIMLLSVLMLLSKSVFTGGFKPNRFFMSILTFQLIMIVYLVTTVKSPTALPKYLPFHLFVIALSIVLIKNRKLRTVNFMPMLFIVSSVLTIIAAIIVYLDLVNIDLQLKGDDAILEVFTLDIASYANFIAGMCLLKKKSIITKIFIFIFFIIDLYVVVQSGKRSYFVAVFFSVLIFLYKNRALIKGLYLGLITAIVLVVFVPNVREATVEMIYRTTEGFATVYSSNTSQSYDENDSASIRKYNQKKILQDVEDNLGVVNIFVGKGYLYAFIDNPLLESFLDMGIIGFFYYVYIVLFIPFIFSKQIRKGDNFSLFFLLNSLVNITVIITNNNPYQYFAYTPICLIAMRYPVLLARNILPKIQQ